MECQWEEHCRRGQALQTIVIGSGELRSKPGEQVERRELRDTELDVRRVVAQRLLRFEREDGKRKDRDHCSEQEESADPNADCPPGSGRGTDQPPRGDNEGGMIRGRAASPKPLGTLPASVRRPQNSVKFGSLRSGFRDCGLLSRYSKVAQ